jgi:photosystem II stability/assembly factor-like uncharacterized protein
LPWRAITSSANGTKLVAIEVNNADQGDIWTSSDSGVTWINRTTGTGESGYEWEAITSSSDGTKLVATAACATGCPFVDGTVWVSSNSGATWSQAFDRGTSAFFKTIASSANCTDLVAADQFGDIWTSTTTGATWTDRTSGAGSKFWDSVTSSSDGTKLAAVVDFQGIWTSSNSGVTWTEQTSDNPNANEQPWLSITSSSDGSNLAAVSYEGNIWTSSDSGVTWVATDNVPGPNTWDSIASSVDGSKLVAVSQVEGGLGDIFTSGDSGSTWVDRTQATGPSGQEWFLVASSVDGTKLAAVSEDDELLGNIWTSTDSGVTWTNRTVGTSAGDMDWQYITSSSDGTHLAAFENDTGDIWTSVDSGVTWVNQTTGTSASGLQWLSLTSSADGTKLAAVEVNNGDIWTSTDSGVTWVDQTTGTDASGQSWESITSSSDGTKLAAAATNGDIWTSSDSGVTWVNQTTGTDAGGLQWEWVTSSADGTVLAAFEYTNDDIWISTDSSVTWTDETAGTSASGQDWIAVALSSDGSKIAAAVNFGDIWSGVIPVPAAPPTPPPSTPTVTSPGNGPIVGSSSFSPFFPSTIEPSKNPLSPVNEKSQPSPTPPQVRSKPQLPSPGITPTPQPTTSVTQVPSPAPTNLLPITRNEPEPTVPPSYGTSVVSSEAGSNVNELQYAGTALQALPFFPALINSRVSLAVSGAALGLFLFFFAVSQIPFSLTNLWDLILNAFDFLPLLVSSQKRSFPWGTVYDSVTKEPLDPAYVQLFDASGKEITSAITDLDGRYGFLIDTGAYRIASGKTHYLFPSRRLSGKTHDILYGDLYFGGLITKREEDEIVCNIPMDPVEFDWNQVQKRVHHLTHFVTWLDPYVLFFCDLLFYAGIAFALWQVTVEPNVFSIGLCVMYAVLLAARLVRGRPPLYGKIMTRDGTPLSFGVVRFISANGFEAGTKVLDAYGRYIGIVSPGSYHIVVEERKSEEELVKVYEADVVATLGVINGTFVV